MGVIRADNCCEIAITQVTARADAIGCIVGWQTAPSTSSRISDSLNLGRRPKGQSNLTSLSREPWKWEERQCPKKQRAFSLDLRT
jgi:hypothetical protein